MVLRVERLSAKTAEKVYLLLFEAVNKTPPPVSSRLDTSNTRATAMSNSTPPIYPHRPGYRLIFRPVITLRNGKKLHAASKGLKAWPIWVREDTK